MLKALQLLLRLLLLATFHGAVVRAIKVHIQGTTTSLELAKVCALPAEALTPLLYFTVGHGVERRAIGVDVKMQGFTGLERSWSSMLYALAQTQAL